MSSLKRLFKLFPLVAWTAAAAFALCLACPGCGSQTGYAFPAGDPELHFVASGLCVTGLRDFGTVGRVYILDGEQWREFGFRDLGGAVQIEYEWVPQEPLRVRVEGKPGEPARRIAVAASAPQRPGLALLNLLDLNPHLGPLKSGRQAAEPTACAVSPDGTWCAVGTNSGMVLLFSIPDGRLRGRAHSAGAYIRSLAFAEGVEGMLLLVGEQSPRGTISAYTLGRNGSLTQIWNYETSRDIGTSRRDPSDSFAWAHLPGIYRILPLGGEEVLVLAAHSQSGEGGSRRSKLYRLRLSDGRLRWSWPRGKPMEAVATWCDSDGSGRTVALCAYDTETGGGLLAVIDGESGRLLAQREIAPLRPHLDQMSFWKSVAVSPDGGMLAALSDDGRAWLWRLGGEGSFRRLTLGEPLDAGGIPLLISGAAVGADRAGAVFVTGTSYLPWHLASGRRPPQTHPDALRALGFGWDGETRWVAAVPNLVQGLVLRPRRQSIFLAYSADPVFSPAGGSGLLVLGTDDLEAPMAAAYPVGGGVMHGSPAVDREGRIVVLVERTRRDPSGERLEGANALHILLW